MTNLPVLVVGGGIAGLSCALRLAEAGRTVKVFESSDAVGGRIRTDEVDGFLLDRGFQVLLTAYPEAQAVFELKELQLGRFEAGALVWFDGKFHRLVDPWRRPRYALATALSPVVSLADKLRLASLRRRVTRGPLQARYEQPETTTIEYLEKRGFSERMLNRFFRPFLGGIFLDADLTTSSRMFEFVFRMFSTGDAALPAKGMGELPRQLTARLPSDAIQTYSPVTEVGSRHIVLEGNRRVDGSAVVVATEAPAAAQLCGEHFREEFNTVTCVYFSADQPPIDGGILLLNGDGRGPINNMCVPSNVCPTYAPAGKALISASVLNASGDDDSLTCEVRQQLQQWFGEQVLSWKHLRTYRIAYALPNQDPPALSPVEKPATTAAGVFVCGDHRDTASIQGAMASGRRAAEAVMATHT